VEETKETKTAVKTPAKTMQLWSTELPQLAKKPLFYAHPLLLYDHRTQTTRFNMTEALAVVHSLQLTMKDVHRFGGDLRPGLGGQVLEMVDCRGPEMRALYRKAAHEFLTEWLPNTFVKDHHIPHAHLATVLLQMHEDRQTACEFGKKLQDPLPLTQVEKAKIPVLVLDAFQQASFLQHESKAELPDDKRTFLVAFPGFDMSQVPAARAKDIADCFKRKKVYPDACLTPQQQKLQLKTVELHLAGVMKGI
jgi:hypothetical protein